ncbi:Piso0_002013 [Millerozyma farinosa CBS 7064]|uniref:Piso0_002013 protein n=1 Tax=Pichia sorbitophila (strain ATCC MYA-4447 / BCRC 22081 / CBS 7064 / NBRC 10061 / NRRL Y-12695) TaxID=559304 RepID=G8YMA7_PICSO|nr:Piso0_002013 [Millerozyma farinosa CBS 7064]
MAAYQSAHFGFNDFQSHPFGNMGGFGGPQVSQLQQLQQLQFAQSLAHQQDVWGSHKGSFSGAKSSERSNSMESIQTEEGLLPDLWSYCDSRSNSSSRSTSTSLMSSPMHADAATSQKDGNLCQGDISPLVCTRLNSVSDDYFALGAPPQNFLPLSLMASEFSTPLDKMNLPVFGEQAQALPNLQPAVTQDNGSIIGNEDFALQVERMRSAPGAMDRNSPVISSEHIPPALSPLSSSAEMHQPLTKSKSKSHHGSSSSMRKKTANLNTQLYKTELCASYVKTGVCPYGSKCQFAHGESELKHVDRPPNWRSKPCANWSKFGTCRYGSRCCFKHGE